MYKCVLNVCGGEQESHTVCGHFIAAGVVARDGLDGRLGAPGRRLGGHLPRQHRLLGSTPLVAGMGAQRACPQILRALVEVAGILKEGEGEKGGG